jgi:hypothetical protein
MQANQLIPLAFGDLRESHRSHRKGARPIVDCFLIFARIGNAAAPKKRIERVLPRDLGAAAQFCVFGFDAHGTPRLFSQFEKRQHET